MLTLIGHDRRLVFASVLGQTEGGKGAEEKRNDAARPKEVGQLYHSYHGIDS
jgi:hypothetical protein